VDGRRLRLKRKQKKDAASGLEYSPTGGGSAGGGGKGGEGVRFTRKVGGVGGGGGVGGCGGGCRQILGGSVGNECGGHADGQETGGFKS